MKTSFHWLVTGLLYLWGGFWAILLISIVLVTALFLPIGRYEPVIRYGCRMLLWLLGFQVTVSGIEGVNPRGTYIFMANHVNIFDVFVLGGYIPGLKRGVEAAEHFSWPLWGAMVKRLGNIPIQRTNLDEAKKSLENAARAVEKGISIVILPEGHRTRDGSLQKFKKGPFHLAVAAGVPVIPVGLSGMWQVKQYKNLHWRPGPIRIAFGEPVPPHDLSNRSVEDLSGVIRQRMLKLIDYDETPRLTPVSPSDPL